MADPTKVPQPLAQNFQIVDGNGFPTQYFIRWAQDRQEAIANGVTIEQVDQEIANWAAARHINAGTGLGGGGPLSADVELHLNAVFGELNDVDMTTPPTAGQVPVWDAVASKWKPGTPAGGGGGGGSLNFLGMQTAANSASLDLTGFITNTYDEYLIEFVSLVLANSTDLLMRVSQNNGTSWDTSGNYQWAANQSSQGGFTGGIGSGGDSGFSLLNAYSNAANNAVNGTLRLYDPLNTTTYKFAVFDSTAYKNDGNYYRNSGAGRYLFTNAINAVQLIARSGNIVSGSVRIYGISKTSSGGGGGSGGYNPMPRDNFEWDAAAAGLGGNNFIARSVYVEKPFTATGIRIAIVSGTQAVPGIYTNNGGSMDALVGQGGAVTVTPNSVIDLPFAAPINLTAGMELWVGVTSLGGTLTTYRTSMSMNQRYFGQGVAALPATAPGQSSSNQQNMAWWLY